MSYLFTPNDIAIFLLKANFTVSDERAVVDDIWKTGEHIDEEYLNDRALFKRHIKSKLISYMLAGDTEEREELELIMRDVDPNCLVFTPLHEQNFILQYFKIIKLELLYIEGKDCHRIKLRTLLRCFGYKRRSSRLIALINDVLSTLSLKPYLRGHEPCDIARISVDDMVMIRLGG